MHSFNSVKLEIIIGYMSSIIFLVLIFVASFIEMPLVVKILLIVFGSVIFVIGVANAVKIEQIAGYYECNICHYKYIPKYSSSFSLCKPCILRHSWKFLKFLC